MWWLKRKAALGPEGVGDDEGGMAGAGEDLLVASADKPFRFPATFTFVVRTLSCLLYIFHWPTASCCTETRSHYN